MDEDSEDIYQTSPIDRYAARLYQLNCICLAEFAANYTNHSGQELKDDTTDVLPIMDCSLLSMYAAMYITHAYGSRIYCRSMLAFHTRVKSGL